MKATITIAIPEDGLNFGCKIIDGNDNVLFWRKMTKEMRSDVVNALNIFADFFASHINDD